MLAKYDTSFVTKGQNVHSVLLSSVHLCFASLKLSRWEKRVVINNVSQCQGVNASLN